MDNGEILLEAIGEISDQLILEAEKEPGHKNRSFIRNLIAACLALCFVVLPVNAEMRTGYISNLLAPFYGGARTEIVDSIGVPVGASVTVGDYTLTADAVIGDRYNIAIVYSLTHVDGKMLPEGLRFDKWSDSGLRGGSGGGSMSHSLSGDGKTLFITEQWTSTERLFRIRRNVTKRFENLVIWKKGQEEEPLVQEGVWELKFTVRYRDTTKTVPVKNISVTGGDGAEYTIQKMELSPVGLHLKMVGTPVRNDERSLEMYKGFTVQLHLRDGRYMEVKDGNLGGGGKLEKGKFKWRYGAMFDTPVTLEEIQSVVVCGTEIPVE